MQQFYLTRHIKKYYPFQYVINVKIIKLFLTLFW